MQSVSEAKSILMSVRRIEDYTRKRNYKRMGFGSPVESWRSEGSISPQDARARCSGYLNTPGYYRMNEREYEEIRTEKQNT